MIGRYLAKEAIIPLMDASTHVGTAGERAAAFAQTVRQAIQTP
jgi:hypothetical protein